MTNPTKPVCYCGKPASGGYLCTEHAGQLNTDLARLQWMLPELVTLLTRQVNTHGPAPIRARTDPADTVLEAAPASKRVLSKSEHVSLVAHAIPFDQAASNMLAEARATLVEICRARGIDFAALIGAA